MSLYIHPENQELLWNIVNQNAYLTAMLSNRTPAQKQEWFKGIIESFYNMNRHRVLGKPDLAKLNKDTLAYMIQMVKAAMPSENSFMYDRNSRTVNSFLDSSPKATSIPTPPVIPDGRADIFNRQFQERQKEYESMLEKKAPAEVNFSEKVEDGVISNMDELIKKQLQERETEFRLYAPPPVLQGPTGTPVSPIASKEENIKFEVEPNKSDISELKTDVETLKELVKNLATTITTLSADINDLKGRFDFGGQAISRTTSGVLADPTPEPSASS
jgi:hypothetical protein